MTPRIIFVPMMITLALALAGTASGKGIASITACGPAGCTNITPKDHSFEAFDFGNGVTDAPARASFYRITFHIREGESRDKWSILFAPYARKVRVPGEEAGAFRWLALFDGRAERLQRMIGDLRPYPADRLPATPKDDLPPAQVVEVFQPARDAVRDNGDGRFDPVPVAAATAVLVAAIALGCVMLARRGRRRRTAGSAA